MKVVITGGTSGLGACIIQSLLTDLPEMEMIIYNLDNSFDDVLSPPYFGKKVENIYCNVTRYSDVQAMADLIGEECDILINCAGINDINFLENVLSDDFDKLMNTNARAIMYTSQLLLPALTNSKGTILNIVSNASHMPMTNSLAYNASKGAAHIMTLQLARELTKKNGITVFGISPNKLAGTKMSQYIDSKVPEIRGWSEEEAKEYQLNGLVTGEETDPAQLAEFITYLLSKKERHKYLSGCILPYGA